MVQKMPRKPSSPIQSHFWTMPMSAARTMSAMMPDVVAIRSSRRVGEGSTRAPVRREGLSRTAPFCTTIASRAGGTIG